MSISAYYSGEGSSCPSLYIWNGTSYVYVAEVSNHGWLGYINYINEDGSIVFWRNDPWDYLKLDKSQLQLKNNIYYDLKKYQLAIKDYQKSISLRPNYRLAYLNRGLAYHKLKQNNLACVDLKKACQLGDCEGLNWAKQNKICPK